MNTLTRRQLNEQIFHDSWAKSVSPFDIYFQEAFESPTAIENQYILSLMGGLKAKHILDLGCGLGDASIYFAQKGALVTAIDISPKMISLVKKFASDHKVTERVQAQVKPAENLSLPSACFDFVYGNGILHHVDFLKAASEIKRVLKKGGRGFFIEPLSYNPIIEIYRRMASRVRTKDEKPLSFQDIENFSAFFNQSSHKEFHFSTQLIFLWYFFRERIHPNQRRYWKKIIAEGVNYSRIFKFLSQLDEMVMKYFPPLSRFCWTTVIAIQK